MGKLIGWIRALFAQAQPQHPPCRHRWDHLQTVNGLYVVYVLQCRHCGYLKKVKV